MDDDRGMTIHFMDGSQMKVSFPKQVKHDESVLVRLERLIDKEVLMIEADGALLAIPFSNVKYFQVYPAPGVLPEFVIKGASVVLRNS
jgi:hypothetical protein